MEQEKHFLEWKDALCVSIYIILEKIRDYQAQHSFSSVDDINI